jgi:hypothetical protein
MICFDLLREQDEDEILFDDDQLELDILVNDSDDSKIYLDDEANLDHEVELLLIWKIYLDDELDEGLLINKAQDNNQKKKNLLV